jgi:hypothetical protein
MPGDCDEHVTSKCQTRDNCVNCNAVFPATDGKETTIDRNVRRDAGRDLTVRCGRQTGPQVMRPRKPPVSETLFQSRELPVEEVLGLVNQTDDSPPLQPDVLR